MATVNYPHTVSDDVRLYDGSIFLKGNDSRGVQQEVQLNVLWNLIVKTHHPHIPPEEGHDISDDALKEFHEGGVGPDGRSTNSRHAYLFLLVNALSKSISIVDAEEICESIDTCTNEKYTRKRTREVVILDGDQNSCLMDISSNRVMELDSETRLKLASESKIEQCVFYIYASNSTLGKTSKLAVITFLQGVPTRPCELQEHLRLQTLIESPDEAMVEPEVPSPHHIPLPYNPSYPQEILSPDLYQAQSYPEPPPSYSESAPLASTAQGFHLPTPVAVTQRSSIQCVINNPFVQQTLPLPCAQQPILPHDIQESDSSDEDWVNIVKEDRAEGIMYSFTNIRS